MISESERQIDNTLTHLLSLIERRKTRSMDTIEIELTLASNSYSVPDGGLN